MIRSDDVVVAIAPNFMFPMFPMFRSKMHSDLNELVLAAHGKEMANSDALLKQLTATCELFVNGCVCILVYEHEMRAYSVFAYGRGKDNAM